MKTYRSHVLSPNDAESVRFLRNQAITIDGGSILMIEDYNPVRHRNAIDRSNCLCLPGLIDLHVHLSQYRIRGRYEPALLPWLKRHVFPEEARSSDISYANALAQEFFDALARAGTTTAVIYTAPFPVSCDTAFENALAKGYRALIGMTMMDQNSIAALQGETGAVLRQCIGLYEKWHGTSPLLDYIFTPRFAPTCSPSLLQGTAEYAATHDAWIQTHLSENQDEIAWVKNLFSADTYTEVYDRYGVLRPKTLLAHCIHLSDQELEMIRDRDAKIVHCPDSNFFLKSGEFPLERIHKHGLDFALGSDVGAGTTLSMLYHAKMYNFRSSSLPVTPAGALYRITLGAADLLGWSDRIGSVETGKEADLIFIEAAALLDAGVEDITSALIFRGHELSVAETLINGKTVHLSTD